MADLVPIESRPDSLAEKVFESLRDAIVGRRLAPGERVTEAALAEQLNVSKTPVREALLRLDHIGLIEPDGRRGGRIVLPSPDGIRNAYEVRTGLEAQAARLAATHATEADIAQITSAANASQDAASAGDLESFRSFDRTFHFSIANATGNPRLEGLIRDAFDLTWTLRRRDVPVADDSVECAAQHVSIADAIASSEPASADEHMRNHLAKVQQLVLDSFATATRV